MTTRLKLRLVLMLAALMLSLGGAQQAEAQKTSLPASVITPSPQPAVISRQLKLAQQLARKALAGLEATSSDDAVPIDESVIQAARDTYVLIRAARHGMELAKETRRFPDPVMDLTFKRVTQAWDLARIPSDQYSWGNTRAEYLRKSIPALSQAVRLLDQVLVTMP
jgi:hypothetical protein